MNEQEASFILSAIGKMGGITSHEAWKKYCSQNGINDHVKYRSEMMALVGSFRSNPSGPRQQEFIETAKTESGVSFYRKYCDNNSFIPSDKACAYFSGKSESTFGSARSQLKRMEGYDFENAGHGCWEVTKRPEEKPSDEQLKSVQEAVAIMKKYQKYFEAAK